MRDANKSKSQLIGELIELRQQVARLELAEAEHKQSDAMLRGRNNRLSSLVEQTIEPLYCFECVPPIPTSLLVEEQIRRLYNCVLVECNDVCARLYGADQAEEVIGKKLTELIVTQSNSLDALFRAIIEGGYCMIDGESLSMLENGSQHYPLINAYGIVENGMLLRMWGSYHNVSERKETEQRLSILASVIDQSKASVVIVDPDGVVLYANPTSFRSNEFRPETIVGQNWRSLTSSNASPREIYPEIRDRVLNKGKVWEGEVTNRLPGGEMVWWEARLFPIKNAKGEISQIVCVSTDITDRKKAEVALQESERRYRLLIESVPTVARVSTLAGETVFISENVEKVYGFSANEILAEGEALWFGRIHPEDKKRVQDALKQLFSTGNNYRVEYRIQRKDGRWIWILDSANVVEEVAGQRQAYGVFSDISDSKQVEEALQLYIDRLKILYQINQGILIAQSTAEIAQVALRWIRQLIPCYRAGVTLFEPGKNQGKIIALEVNGKTRLTVGTSIPIDWLIINKPVREQLIRGEIIVRKCYPTDHVSEILYQEGIRTSAYVPLVYEGELIGSLNLAWADPYTLTSVQEDIAREVAAQLSIAIRQSQLQEAEKRRRKELEILEHVSTAFRYADRLEDLYTLLIDEFKALFSADAGEILIHENSRMECAYIYGSEQFKEQIRHQEKITVELYRILLQGKSSFNPEGEFGLQDISSIALLPFQSKKSILGGAVLFWSKHHEFSEEERRLLNTVADVAGIALHRMKIMGTLEQRIEDRTRELSALYDVTAVSSRSLDLQEILDQSLLKVLGAMRCEIGIIHLQDEANKTLRLVACQGFDPQKVQQIISYPNDYRLAKEVLEQKRAVVISDLVSIPLSPDLARQAIGRPYAGVPIRAKDRILGVLSVVGAAGSSYSKEAVSLLVSISDQIGIAIENARLYEQAQQAAILSERHRLARDLHDSVTQSLYSLNLMAATGLRLVESGSDKEEIVHTFNRLGTAAHQALKEMRLLLYELRSSALEKEELVGALRQRLEAVEGRAEIKTQLHVDDLPKLPSYVQEGLYHIAQEALNNALKHAESTQTDIAIRCQNDCIVLEVRDNGKGFVLDEQWHNHGMGLASMKERAKALGGELKITSQPGTGTCVSVRLKVTQVDD